MASSNSFTSCNATPNSKLSQKSWGAAACGGRKGQEPAEIEESILDPNAKITQGYPANVMPQNFKETIKPEEIKELVKFLSENAGKSKE